MNCPICQKAGISNEVKYCPQCNSDLSAFKLIDGIENEIKNRTKKNVITAITSLVIGGLLTYSILSFSSKIVFTESKKSQSIISKHRKDSIEIYKRRYDIIKDEIDSLKESKSLATINYKVKPGDNLSTIANMFFNDIKKAEEIARLNNIANPNLIKVNQVLKIQIME